VLSQTCLSQGHAQFLKKPYRHLFQDTAEIEFKSYKDPQDAKNGKRYGLFLNEAQGVSWEIAEELISRVTGPIFIDYNPTAEFWVHDYILGRDDVWFNQSTFKDNEHCPQAIVDEIMLYYERWQETGLTYWENKWKIYGLGQLGVSEDRVFNNVERVSEFPKDCKRVGYGMDFGFKNDPTALIKCGIHGNDIYVQQMFYDYGMTDKDIFEALISAGVTRYIVGDGGGGGDRVIHNLRQRGIGIREAKKEEIQVGIMKLHQYNIKVVRPSKDLWTEFRKYRYREIKGRMTNLPIDRYNHGIDSIRYWAIEALKLGRRTKAAGVYVP
jgi:phage terminase large subunit